MEGHHETFFTNPRTYVGLAFLIFFLIFGAKIVSSVLGILDKRSQAIRNELDEASRLRAEAERMLQEAQANREQSQKDADALMAQAREEAGRVAESARTDAANAAKRRERLAMERIAAAEKAAVAEVRIAAAETAARAASRVIAKNFGAEADGKLINDAIQGLPSALAKRRAA